VANNSHLQRNCAIRRGTKSCARESGTAREQQCQKPKCEEGKRCGYVAIIGKPNVGKSTLLNKIIARKISITAAKPQTTRHKISGIKTIANMQIIYVDTPGIHAKQKYKLNHYMNKVALKTMTAVDVILFMVNGLVWEEEDEHILEYLKNVKCPVILLINKVDTIDNKGKLLPYLEELNKKMNFTKIIPISATKGTNVDVLEKTIVGFLPEGAFLFPEKQTTDRDDKFLAAEIIREKLVRWLGQELPYATTVVIESFANTNHTLRISATIFVERAGQKIIIIGKQGSVLKKIGTLARQDMEQLFHRKIFLTLWVKVNDSWSDDAAALERLGYN